jgi:putative glutamine amidotransferase
MKPLIGVTCNYREKVSECHNNYSTAVAKAGGIPLVLPQIADDPEVLRETLDRLGGVVIIGGADIPPGRYGEAPHPKANPVAPERDRMDFLLIDELKRRDFPTLAICYGIQALNVAYGGTLYQDIAGELPGAVKHHRDASKNEPRQWHAVRVVPGTLLHRILGVERLETNSSHHQALKEVPPTLVKSAFCVADGLVEAIEDPARRFMLGIQWHPESLTDHERHLWLFQALVEEASQ